MFVRILPSKSSLLSRHCSVSTGEFHHTNHEEKAMSDVAKCPCCGAVAKVTRDEHGMPATFRAIQDEELPRKVLQLKKALSKFVGEKSPEPRAIE
jgi:hypothetical protein